MLTSAKAKEDSENKTNQNKTHQNKSKQIKTKQKHPGPNNSKNQVKINLLHFWH